MPIGQLGMAAIDIGKNAANAGLGLMLQRSQDKRQLNMSRKLQRMQMEGDKEMTNYNFQKQLEMWEATGYGAQMKQLKNAGLNPALLYGMGGAGGQTAGIQQGNTNTGHAPTGGAEITSMLGMGIQRELLQAQKENIQAQTEKTKAETANVPLTGQNIQATTSSLLQGINNQTAQEALTRAETALKELETKFQDETLKNRASIINLTLSKLIEETHIIENERQISDATKEQKIKILAAQLANIAADTLKKDKEAATTEAEKLKIDQEIKNLQQQFDINTMDQRMSAQGFNPKNGGIFKWMWNMMDRIFRRD